MKISLSILALVFSSASLACPDYDINTGALPPYSYEEGGVIKGLATDVVREIQKTLGNDSPIEIVPWARSIANSVNNKTITYPLARLPDREDQYNWVGPILEDQFYFYTHKSNLQPIEHIEQLKRATIGVNRGAPTEKRLLDKDFSSIISFNGEGKIPPLLQIGRVDYWYSSKLIIQETIKKLGLNIDDFVPVLGDLEIEMYIAMSLDMKNESKVWQSILNTILDEQQHSQSELIARPSAQ